MIDPPERPSDPVPPRKPRAGGPPVPRATLGNSKTPPAEEAPRKPFSFALTGGNGGARVWFGKLVVNISKATFEKVTINGTDASKLVTQAAIENVVVVVPAIFSGITDLERLQSVELGFYGNVYLAWHCDSAGTITYCEVVGPDEPTARPIPALNADMERQGVECGVEGDADSGGCDECSGRFWVKLGSVASDSTVVQDISGDVTWNITLFEGQCISASSSGSSDSGSSGSGSDSGSSDSSGGASSSGPSDSGSDKSTAIVPAGWMPSGYTALFTAEMPEVRFEDVMTFRITGRRTLVRIDPRFVAVCAEGTMSVCGISADVRGSFAAVVRGGHVEVTAGFLNSFRHPTVTIRLTAIRKGLKFQGLRFPSRTRAQFVANEAFINSAYPPSENV